MDDMKKVRDYLSSLARLINRATCGLPDVGIHLRLTGGMKI